jgi:hypothetical protein
MALPASGPLLPGDELVKATEEDFARQVPAQVPAEGASNGDGLEGELLPARRLIAARCFQLPSIS